MDIMSTYIVLSNGESASAAVLLPSPSWVNNPRFVQMAVC
jgi:hypothetical protein